MQHARWRCSRYCYDFVNPVCSIPSSCVTRCTYLPYASSCVLRSIKRHQLLSADPNVRLLWYRNPGEFVVLRITQTAALAPPQLPQALPFLPHPHTTSNPSTSYNAAAMVLLFLLMPIVKLS